MNRFYFYFLPGSTGLVFIGHGPELPTGAVGRLARNADDAEAGCLFWRGFFVERHAGDGWFRPSDAMRSQMDSWRHRAPDEPLF